MANKTNKNSKRRSNVAGLNYPVGDFLIRVKNAGLARNKTVEVGYTKLIAEVAKVLKDKKILDEVDVKDQKVITRLAYIKKEPVLIDVKLISKPGLRVYGGAAEIEKIKSPSFLIISTSKGVMSDRDAVKKNLGGEFIAEIF